MKGGILYYVTEEKIWESDEMKFSRPHSPVGNKILILSMPFALA